MLSDLKSATQNVLHLFRQPGSVRLAVLFSLDAGSLKKIDLLGQFAAFFQQSSHDLEWPVVIGKPPAETHADSHEALHQIGFVVHVIQSVRR